MRKPLLRAGVGAALAATLAVTVPQGSGRPAAGAHGTVAAPAEARSATADSQVPAPAAFAGGRAVVGLTRGVDGRSFAVSFGLTPVRSLPELRLVEVAGSPAALARLARRGDPRARYVEPVRPAELAHARNDPLTTLRDTRVGVPYEWQFHAVGVDQALNLAPAGAGVLVGVVDSGVSAVPDLAGRVAKTLWDPKTSVSALDTIGHGTFISSIIAARNDDGFGLAGFCGRCRLAVYKASPLTDVEIAAGIQKLTDAHVRIINLSLIEHAPSQVVVDAIGYATAAGVLVVAAVGNEGSNGVDFPSSLLQPPNGAAAGGIAVGASDASGARASFSNWGAGLSLLAPGTYDSGCRIGILGALPAIATDFEDGGACGSTIVRLPGGRYAYASGTSFAAAEVSGVAALVWSIRPDLTNVQVADVLEQSATRPPRTAWGPAAGWGVLNAKAAAERAAGRSSDDTVVLRGLSVTGRRAPGAKLRATVAVSWGNGDPIVSGARPTCRMLVHGHALRVAAALRRSQVTCSFRVPHGDAAVRVSGTIGVTGPGTVPAAAPFAVVAHPNRRP